MQVEFRKITGYYNYSVSNTGLVRNDSTGRILRLDICNGYYIAKLYIIGKGNKFEVHKLVAETFIPNPDNKPFVDHIDNNKQNNHADNLRWCTNQENLRNSSIRKDNKSGVKGVRLENGKWRAQINVNGKNTHIGYYNTLEAQAARQLVAAENFGDFINNCEKAPIININIIENVVINN